MQCTHTYKNGRTFIYSYYFYLSYVKLLFGVCFYHYKHMSMNFTFIICKEVNTQLFGCPHTHAPVVTENNVERP